MTDYLTKYRVPSPPLDAHHQPSRWSGIIEASLAKATMTLPEVQTQLLTIFAPSGILQESYLNLNELILTF